MDKALGRAREGGGLCWLYTQGRRCNSSRGGAPGAREEQRAGLKTGGMHGKFWRTTGPGGALFAPISQVWAQCGGMSCPPPSFAARAPQAGSPAGSGGACGGAPLAPESGAAPPPPATRSRRGREPRGCRIPAPVRAPPAARQAAVRRRPVRGPERPAAPDPAGGAAAVRQARHCGAPAPSTLPPAQLMRLKMCMTVWQIESLAELNQ